MSSRTVLVTQALQFVGPPAAEALHRDGFRVLGEAPEFVDPAQRQAFEARLPGSIALPPASAEGGFEERWERYGPIDVLVSNDVYPAIHRPLESLHVDELRQTIEALVVAPFALLQAAVPRMKARGRGNLILVTSCRGELPMPGGCIPDLARAAANALVRSLAIELAPHGIPVNAIAPNFLYSEAYFPRARFIDDPDGRRYIESVVPAGRLGRPEEIGELVSYLAGMRGSFHTGSVIPFAGGWPAAPRRPS